MSISNCPKCEAEVLLPASTDAAARVKCPLCDEEYTLGDVLEKLPPALVLLDVPALAETSSPSGEFGAMFGGDGPSGGFSFDSDGPGLQLEGDDDSSGISSSGVSFDSEEGAAATAALTTSPRKQKPKKSIGKELVKIVLGGVGGLVIAYGILLWGFGRDPLPIAPELPPQMLWVIPKDLRAGIENPKPKKETNAEKQKPKPAAANDGPEATSDFVDPEGTEDLENKFNQINTPSGDNTEGDEPEENGESDPTDKPTFDAPTLDDLESPDFDPFGEPDTSDPLPSDKGADIPTIEEPKSPNDAPSDEPKPNDLETIPTDPLDTLPVDPEVDPPATKPDDTDPDNTVPDTDDPSPTDEPSETKPPAETPTLRISDPITAKNLDAELEKVRSAVKTLSPQDPVEKTRVTKDKFKAFGQLCTLAWARTRASSPSDNSSENSSDNASEKQQLAAGVKVADGLIDDIAADHRQAKVIGQLANVALTRDLAESGMVLTGMVGEITQVGALHRVSIVLPAWEPNIKVQVVTVLCSELPELKLNDQILVVGAVVDKPADDIPGFGGKNEQVIWAAVVRRLSTEADDP